MVKDQELIASLFFSLSTGSAYKRLRDQRLIHERERKGGNGISFISLLIIVRTKEEKSESN
jgi:hypothetical protein